MRTAARLVLVALLAAPVVVGVSPVALGRTAAAEDAPVTVVVTMAETPAAPDLGDRSAATRSAQESVLAELAGPAPVDVHHLTTGNVLVATVTGTQRLALAADPRVAAVGLDMVIPGPADPPAAPTPRRSGAQSLTRVAPDTLSPVDAPADACTGTESSPQLEPEALGTMNVRSDDPAAATAAALGYDGAGVDIGIVTTNLDPQAPNFIRPDGSSVITDYRAYGAGGVDALGAAGEAFGDASSIGAQGTVTSDLADVVNPDAVTLPGGHCWIRIVGVAPGSDLVVSDVHDQGLGNVTLAGMLLAIDYSVTMAEVDVLSESIGFTIIPDAGLRSAVQAVNAGAVAAGVTVVVSSGDSGPNNTIEAPATLPGVISVGATTTSRIWAQVGAAGISRFGNGTWQNGSTTFFSSSGSTMTARTIDLVAPGSAGWSTCSTQPQYLECDAVGDAGRPADVFPFGGTSQSAPFVAGVAALVIQAYRDGHGGTDPSPDQVRRILTGTATDLGLPADLQGNGQVDARAAVLAARNLPADGLVGTPSTPVGDGADTLVADLDQLAATRTTDLPVDVTVTNTGDTPVDLGVPSLTEDAVTTRSTHPIAFAPDAPAFLDGYSSFLSAGGTMPLVATTQQVVIPAGVPWARLQVLADPVAPGDDVDFLQVAAIAPDGSFVNGGRSTSGIQLVLPAPKAGSWTVVVQAVQGAEFTGLLALDLARRSVVATATPSIGLLAPGASARVSTTLALPGSPGDRVTTLRIGGQLQIPVVLRRPVDLTTRDALTVAVPQLPTAGHGGTPQQTATWEIDVPPDRRSLSAVLSVGATSVLAALALIDPDGATVSVSSSADGNPAGPGDGGIQSSVAEPRAGRWTVIALIYGSTYDGRAVLDAPLTVDLSLDATRPVATGLPQGAEIARNTDLPVTLQVVNPGGDTLQIVGDARTGDVADVTLTPIAGGGPVTLPVGAGQPEPVYLVPQFSTVIRASASATVPVVFGVYDSTGSRDAISAPGLTPGVAITGRLTPGPWFALFNVPGAVVGASPAGTATVAASVRTAAFDTTVTHPDGTGWMSGSGPATQPAAIAPGATGSLAAVLHVDAPVGTRVDGFLAVETLPTSNIQALQDNTGDVLALFPYSYIVGPASAPPPAPDPEPTTGPTPTAPTTVTSTDTSTATATASPATTTIVRATITRTDGPGAGATSTSTSVVALPAVDLARTGSDVLTPGVWGLLLFTVGAGLTVVARRRRPGAHHR